MERMHEPIPSLKHLNQGPTSWRGCRRDAMISQNYCGGKRTLRCFEAVDKFEKDGNLMILRSLASRILGREWAGGASRSPHFANDDHDWDRYHRDYRREIEALETSLTARLSPDDAAISDGHLELKEGLPPLHPNHRLLYETILLLEPSEVVEAGCGGGDHVHNLSLLLPDAHVHGFDRSPDQIAFAVERAPNLVNKLGIADLTLPLPQSQPGGDVVFTQAVIMHIHTGNGHLVALANLFRLARRQVVLMENWTQHDFMSDIKKLHAAGIIDWADLRFYLRRSRELENKPHMMVVSRDELPFEELTDYSVLTAPLEEWA